MDRGWVAAVRTTDSGPPCARWMRHAQAAVRLLRARGDMADLFAGWLAADGELAAGAAMEDALRVGWSVTACLAGGPPAGPYGMLCRHLRLRALRALLVAERHARRRGLCVQRPSHSLRGRFAPP